MAKAERNSVYELNGNYFTIRAGDTLPEGATITETIDDSPEAQEKAQQRTTEERAQEKAPENKARQSAPQSKSQ